MVHVTERIWSEEMDQRLRTLYGEGLSFSALAERFGFPEGAIRRRVVKLGLPKRGSAVGKRLGPPANAPKRPRAGESTLPPLDSLQE